MYLFQCDLSWLNFLEINLGFGLCSAPSYPTQEKKAHLAITSCDDVTIEQKKINLAYARREARVMCFGSGFGLFGLEGLSFDESQCWSKQMQTPFLLGLVACSISVIKVFKQYP